MTTTTGRHQRNKNLFAQGFKECCDCRVVKELCDFTPVARLVSPGASSVASACRACRTERNRELRAADPGRAALRAKHRAIQHTYGLTMEQWNALFEAQKGCCAICRKHSSEIKRGLAVDHNHETGVVRALLCQPCNIAIGMFAEDPSTLAAAIEYLRRHNSGSI